MITFTYPGEPGERPEAVRAALRLVAERLIDLRELDMRPDMRPVHYIRQLHAELEAEIVEQARKLVADWDARTRPGGRGPLTAPAERKATDAV